MKTIHRQFVRNGSERYKFASSRSDPKGEKQAGSKHCGGPTSQEFESKLDQDTFF